MSALTTTYTPAPRSLYGRIISAVDVEQALVERVGTRVNDYLLEVERQHGIAVGTIQRPRAMVVAERFPEDQLPAIIVESPGTADLPLPDGQGRYTARFEVVLTIAVSASAGALELAKLYAAALRTLAVQQVAALFMGVDWINERYPRPELVGGRTFYTAEVALEVQVAEVTDRHSGPTDEWPDVDPGGPGSPEWPTAASADVELDKTPIDGDVEEGS